MRKLSGLWQALEQADGLLGVPASWQERCGQDFALLEPYLLATDRMSSIYPCPNAPGDGCPRRIIDFSDLKEGDIVAICQHPWKACGDVPLTLKEVLLHEVDISGFMKIIAPALGIRWEPLVECGYKRWSIGVSERRSSRGLPVYLVALPTIRQFTGAVNDLILDRPGPFLLVAPTNRQLTAEVQRRLQSREIPFVNLEEELRMDGSGELVFLDPTEPLDSGFA